MRISLRLRLAAWYAALLTLISILVSVLSYGYHSASHYAEVDRSLATTAIHVMTDLKGKSEADLKAGVTIPPAEEYSSPDTYVRVYDAEGDLLVTSSNVGHQAQTDPRTVLAAGEPQDTGLLSRMMRPLVDAGHPLVSENAGFLTVLSTGGQGRTRIYALPLVAEGGIQGYLETGSSLDRLDESMNRLALLLTGTTLVGLLAALL
ncbi:MAG TPA: hypothetical protein VF960_04160, partial [Chloroflexota bacterium]